jgi:hypothetical protein
VLRARQDWHVLNVCSRFLIALIAAFLSIAFLAQIFSIFTAMELRNIINNQVGNISNNQVYYQQPDLLHQLLGVPSTARNEYHQLQVNRQ